MEYNESEYGGFAACYIASSISKPTNTINKIVRINLMADSNYTPYCGNSSNQSCYLPRTIFRPVDGQFICPNCKWISSFPEEFIKEYRTKWNK